MLEEGYPDTFTSIRKSENEGQWEKAEELKAMETRQLEAEKPKVESTLEVHEEASEPLSPSIDLFPLEDLVGPIPEWESEQQDLLIDLQPLDELLPHIPDVTQPGSLVVDLQPSTDDSL